MLLNVLMNIWARAIRADAPDVTPAVFADDAGAYSSDAAAVQKALEITGKFASVTKQRLNVEKSKAFSFTQKSDKS